MITTATRTAAALLLVLALASCGNTIRGFGKDASNTVDATEDAAKDVSNYPEMRTGRSVSARPAFMMPVPVLQAPAASMLCLRLMKSLAVSTAIAASRQ